MPLKLNLGLSKKIGLPDYGSLGASCHIEIELEHSLLENDLDGFHERVRKVFIACRQAVSDELARQQEPMPYGRSRKGVGPHPNGNGTSRGLLTSAKQIEYAQQLAKQISGIGVRRLETLAQRMHAKPLASHSTIEASALIDVLRGVKAGKIDLTAALQGTAT